MAHRCSYCGKAGHKRPTCPARITPSTIPVETMDEALASLPKPEPKEKKKSKAVTQWNIAEAVLPHCDRTLLYGPPGTGKTTAGNFVARDGIEVYNVTLTEEMPAAELRGHYVPRGGEFVWVDGPAMQAYRNGGRLVLNEIDRGSSDALIFCYALLDDPGISRITLPTGESVTPHPDFTVVATTNGDPSDLPEALADRFNVRIHIDTPHPDAMKSLPDDLRDHAHNSVSGDAESRVSFRSWKSFARLRDLVGEDMAAKAVFGPRSTSIMDTIKLTRSSSKSDTTFSSHTPRESGVFYPGDTVEIFGSHTHYDGKLYVVKESPNRFGHVGMVTGEQFARSRCKLIAPAEGRE